MRDYLVIAWFVVSGCGGGGSTGDATSDVQDGIDSQIADAMDGASHDAFDAATPDVAGDMASCSVTCGCGYGECNPVTNEGCTSPQSCILAADAGGTITAVCATPGTGGISAPCSVPTDCLPGFACLGSGVCMPLCCGPGDDAVCRAAPGARPNITCATAIAGVNFYACTPEGQCDPFAQDCPLGLNCVRMDPAGDVSCVAAGTGAEGSMCTSQSDCAVALLCVRDASSNTSCRRICDPTYIPHDGGSTEAGVREMCPNGFLCGEIGLGAALGVCLPH